MDNVVREALSLRQEIRELTFYIKSISPRLARHKELCDKRSRLQKRLNILVPLKLLYPKITTNKLK